MEPRLTPPPSRGHLSVAHVPDAWYIACASVSLKKKPVSIRILGTPLVLFRGAAGHPGALLDRCPHRNVPLSVGSVEGEHLQCAYHGWRFDSGGECRDVPGLDGDPTSRGRAVPSYACMDRDGFVWVYMQPDTIPDEGPFRFELLGAPGYKHVIRELEARATLHATIENALDVPHTAFLHKGLFRDSDRKRSRIDVRVKATHDRVEAEYIGEARPEGLVGRILSPSGGVVTHFDRFILPSIAQVEYRIGEENHILVSAVCTPVSDFVTRLFAVVCFRTRIPSWLLKPVATPLGLKIFHQDTHVLDLQSRTIEEFGGESYASTEIDVLGPQIMRLLRLAERGELPDEDAEPVVRELTMLV